MKLHFFLSTNDGTAFIFGKNQPSRKRGLLLTSDPGREDKPDYRRKSHIPADSRHRMQIYIEKLKGLSPLEKLGQGYSYTADVHGRKITQTGQVKKGDTICVYVSDGRLQAKVTDIQKDKQDAGEV